MLDNSARFRPDEDDVFGRIAARYDRLCDVFSLGVHRLWKSRMATRIANERPGLLVDLASGTADIPCRLWRRLGASAPDWRIRVTDISPQMLAIAQGKLARFRVDAEITEIDACAIDAPTGSVDIVSMAFGLRSPTGPS